MFPFHLIRKLLFALPAVGLIALASCNETANMSLSGKNEVLPSPNCCEDSAMAHFMQQPELSIALLDSAAMLDRLSADRAQYLKAMIYYSALGEPSRCIDMCKELVDQKVWVKIDDNDASLTFHVELLRLLVQATSATSDIAQAIQYATEGARLAHGHNELRSDEADFYSRMGLTMCKMGQTDEGLKSMHEAERLTAGDNNWGAIVSYLNNAKKIYAALMDVGRLAEAEDVVNQAIARLNRTEHSPEEVTGMPQAMRNDKAALAEFAEFYRTSFTAYMVKIKVLKGEMEEAQIWYRKFKETAFADNPAITQAIILPLISMGEMDEARRRIDLAKKRAGNDTIATEYVTLLRYEQQMARQQGNLQEALQLADRVQDISDQLQSQQYMKMVADASTRFHLQEEQTKHREAKRQFYALLNGIVFVVLIIILSILGTMLSRMLAKHKKQDIELTKTRHELETLRHQSENAETANKPVKEDTLYQRACLVMEKHQPYTNPDFDITTLAQMVFTNRSYLSAVINKRAGMNFRSWIARYRIELAKKQLLQHPSISMESLSTVCGFDSRSTLYRNFKNLEGMLPAEWLRRKLVEQAPKPQSESSPNDKSDKLADSHDASHLPEGRPQDAVTDDDNVADDGQR